MRCLPALLLASFVLLLALSNNAKATTLTVAPGWEADLLYVTAANGISSIGWEDDLVLFGEGETMKAVHRLTKEVTIIAEPGGAARGGFSVTDSIHGMPVAAYTDSYAFPPVYRFDHIFSGALYNYFEQEGFFDFIFTSRGDLFFTAAGGFGETLIYRIDPRRTQVPFVFAEVGGFSGGLATDGENNLYYAYNALGGGGAILRFQAAQLREGEPFVRDDAQVLVPGVAAGYLATSRTRIYATTGFGPAEIRAYDRETGASRGTVATLTGQPFDVAFTGMYRYRGAFYVSTTTFSTNSGAIYRIRPATPDAP